MSFERNQASGAYRPWRPEAFDRPPREEAPPAPRTAPPEAPPPPPPPREPAFALPTADDIERMFEEARREGHATGLAEGLPEGRQNGHAEGLAKGYEEGRAAAAAEAARLAGAAAQLEAALAALEGEVAEEIAALAIEMARQLVRRTLADDPAVVADTVRAALAQLPHTEATIRLHPDDVALARDYLGETLTHGGHRIVEDPAISRGGCLLEAGGSQIDATLQTRWRRVLEGMGRADAGQWDDDGS